MQIELILWSGIILGLAAYGLYNITTKAIWWYRFGRFGKDDLSGPVSSHDTKENTVDQ